MQQAPDELKVRSTRFAVVRNTKVQLKKTTLKTFLHWFKDGVVGRWKSSDMVFEMKFDMPDGTRVDSEFHFMGLDTADDRDNLLSFELTGVWLNEFRELPFDLVKDLLGRIGRWPPKNKDTGYQATWTGVIGDTNPYDVDSVWYDVLDNPSSTLKSELAAEAARRGLDMPKFTCFHQPGGMSPEAENLDNLLGEQQYYFNQYALAKSEGRDENWINVHIHGKPGFTMDGKPVYGQDYKSDVHLSETRLAPVPDRAIGVGMDFGTTPAAVFGQKDYRGFWLILDELIAVDQMGTEQFEKLMAAFVTERWPGYKLEIFGDPAGQQKSQVDLRSCFDLLRDKGYNIVGSEQSPLLRQNSVRSVLNYSISGTPQFRMNKSCSVLHKGFIGGYQYKRMRVSGERYADSPDKNSYSHPHDALQYLIARFEAPRLQGLMSPAWPKNETRRHMTQPIQMRRDPMFSPGRTAPRRR